MKTFLLAAIAALCLPAFGQSVLAPNQNARFTYTNNRLVAGAAQITLVHERGEKVTVKGTVTVANGVQTLQFTCPSLTAGEWQVYAVLIGSTSVHLGTLFEVKQ